MAEIKSSLTKDFRDLLNRATPRRLEYNLDESHRASEDTLLSSIHAVALERGKTLQDYIYDDPEKALMTAQLIHGNWETVLTNAALTGAINGQKISREGVKLIERAVMNSRNDIDTVQMIMAAGSPDELNKDRVMMAMLNKALQGNIKAMQYMIDRVEGRAGETKEASLDFDHMLPVYLILHSLFGKQLEVINAGPGTKMCCCGRKAGKTHLLAAILLLAALRRKNHTVMYISQTKEFGEKYVIGPALNELIAICDLRTSKNEKLNWRRLENGSRILIRGLSNTKDPDAIRGPNAGTIVIDEFFHLNDDLLEYLYDEVLGPMSLVYGTNYEVVLVGTPPRTRGTFGEKCWTELNVPKFHWTGYDNPYIKDFDAYVQKKCDEKGIDINHPYIRREYFGEWKYDEDALLYPIYYTWNDEVPPTINIDCITIGLDYGTSANDAIIAVAWDKTNRKGFIFYEIKFSRLTCPPEMTQLKYLEKCCKELWEYSLDFFHHLDPIEANRRVIWSADTTDGHVTDDFRVNLQCRYPELRMNIGNAHKLGKIQMQDKIRDLFRTANLLVPEGGPTERELKMTILKRDAKGNLMLDIDDKAYHPDLLPALRYAMWEVIGEEITRKYIAGSDMVAIQDQGPLSGKVYDPILGAEV